MCYYAGKLQVQTVKSPLSDPTEVLIFLLILQFVFVYPLSIFVIILHIVHDDKDSDV